MLSLAWTRYEGASLRSSAMLKFVSLHSLAFQAIHLQHMGNVSFDEQVLEGV
jgi:hypothetical protein